MAMTAPSYCCRCCSSHSTLSASRWLVGSSSSSRSGFSSSSLHSATRRRSPPERDRKSTRLNSSHVAISYAVFCLKKKKDASGDERSDQQRTQTTDNSV